MLLCERRKGHMPLLAGKVPNISQGRVVTHSSCGGIFGDHECKSTAESVKEFRKSVGIVLAK